MNLNHLTLASPTFPTEKAINKDSCNQQVVGSNPPGGLN